MLTPSPVPLSPPSARCFTAFAGTRKIGSASLRALAVALKDVIERDPEAQILVFDDASGAQVDMNLHGSIDAVLARLPLDEEKPEPVVADTAAQHVARAPGRPKLGVVAREVSLLPRHWEWLTSQQGGASVALRKLVEHAQRTNQDADLQRQARDATYRFINAMAGDAAGFEEACRALFAGNATAFHAQIATWPTDIREHARQMAGASFGAL